VTTCDLPAERGDRHSETLLLPENRQYRVVVALTPCPDDRGHAVRYVADLGSGRRSGAWFWASNWNRWIADSERLQERAHAVCAGPNCAVDPAVPDRSVERYPRSSRTAVGGIAIPRASGLGTAFGDREFPPRGSTCDDLWRHGNGQLQSPFKSIRQTQRRGGAAPVVCAAGGHRTLAAGTVRSRGDPAAIASSTEFA